MEGEKHTLVEDRKRLEDEKRQFEDMMREFHEEEQRREDERLRQEEADSGIGSRADTAEVIVNIVKILKVNFITKGV